MRILEIYKANKIKLHNVEKEFASKSEAIRYLLKEGKLKKTQIAERLNVTNQQIYLAEKKIKEENNNLTNTNP